MYFADEPEWQKEIIRNLAKKYNTDVRIIRQIVYYPYVFLSNRINDFNDLNGVRLRYLGIFAPKKRFLKQKEYREFYKLKKENYKEWKKLRDEKNAAKAV